MKNQTSYEWKSETFDDHGDIQEIEHGNKLSSIIGLFDELPEGRAGRAIVLIRDTGNDVDGLKMRLYAYVDGDKLAAHFNDGDRVTGYKVPKRFIQELGRVSMTMPVNSTPPSWAGYEE